MAQLWSRPDAGAPCELSLPSHSMEPQRKLDTISIGSHAMNLGGGPVSIFTWGSQCRLWTAGRTNFTVQLVAITFGNWLLKWVDKQGYITVVVSSYHQRSGRLHHSRSFPEENNSCQSYSSHHQHEPIATDTGIYNWDYNLLANSQFWQSSIVHCPYTWGFSPFPVGIAISL